MKTDASMTPLILVTLLLSAIVTAQERAVDESTTVKVFLLAGQSNMEGHAVADLDHEEHYNGGRGNLKSVLADEDLSKTYGHWVDSEGRWTTRDDVFVSYRPARGPMKAGPLSIGYAVHPGAHHFGPELEFGRVVGDHFEEPVLLVKTCWGGKSLMEDFRPPGSGGEVGPCYRKMIEEYHEAIAELGDRFPELKGMKTELAGFVWFQGWNDMYVEGALDAYAENLSNLIKDVRREFQSPDLPFVVGQTGNADNEALWEGQRAATLRPEFKGQAIYVPTRSFLRDPDDSPNKGHAHHWFGNAESYLRVGTGLGRAMVTLQKRRP
ncbi:MAG: sialate O-acetylesterase [Phycisphaerae bacterium]|nr:sialate O-acetylesterase [Phycisphaerae bacterium]